MEKINIILMYGGGGKEHAISKLSSEYLLNKLNFSKRFHIEYLLLNEEGLFINQEDKVVFFGADKKMLIKEAADYTDSNIKIDYIIPCFHGTPGETGEIQALLDLLKIPYLGPGHEASVLSFNKISTKLWLEHANVPTTPYIIIKDQSKKQLENAAHFFKVNKDIFVKASSEGSALGIYHCQEEKTLEEQIKNAFSFSNQVLLEKTNKGRELEIACFEYKGELIITDPGEIICVDDFYDYHQKYNQTSTTKTQIKAQGLNQEVIQKLKEYAFIAYHTLGLKDLSRIDFFLNNDGVIYLNEVNTFPGLTPISMFPKMMEASGVKFEDYLIDRIDRALKGDI